MVTLIKDTATTLLLYSGGSTLGRFLATTWKYLIIEFPTQRNSGCSCDSFHFLVERIRESVNHQRLEVKHITQLSLLFKPEQGQAPFLQTLTKFLSTSSSRRPLGTKASARSLMAWIMLIS